MGVPGQTGHCTNSWGRGSKRLWGAAQLHPPGLISDDPLAIVQRDFSLRKQAKSERNFPENISQSAKCVAIH